ncbi:MULTISPECIES: helix-turn-helix transcriptional regulator [unclassified Kitasatospora]|uniref:helix-turn-helix transcriptional regulator n=1 Tax=unclassified Kitasatospora TaxID=2633591 RepID=UPI00070EC975|nr:MULTISPECIES: helix-turn-helix transcriptional regulator [unclassified Kitasatospora]KQV20842.1 hypothetical protein ASC99_20245 [Kitasatospora sp. Root107]KRB60502.1 hypothetical protein ASE03_12930 [Kitasatospora sp. Root187]
MTTSVAAPATSTRDLDRHLRRARGLVVTTAALTTPGRSPATEAHSVTERLVLRALSARIACALIVPTDAHPLPDLTRWPVVVRDQSTHGVNAFRAAATLLSLPERDCLALCTDPQLPLAQAGGCPTVVATKDGALHEPGQSVPRLTERERQIVAHFATGHTAASAAHSMGIAVSTIATLASRLHHRLGFNDRGHTLAHCLAGGLVDTAPLRATLPEQPPVLPEIQVRLLTLATGHNLTKAASLAGVPVKTVKTVLADATRNLSAHNRAHAIALGLLYEIVPASAAPARRLRGADGTWDGER